MESSLRWDAVISIHALHEESDKLAEPVSRHRTISIHALHEESETQTVSFALVTPFQSTLSMRRATFHGG